MAIFPGTFLPSDRIPGPIEGLAALLPTTHLIVVKRPLTTGEPLAFAPILIHSSDPVLPVFATFWLAHHRLSRRLFD